MRNWFLSSDFYPGFVSQELKIKKRVWLQRNVFVVCPFCSLEQNIAYTEASHDRMNLQAYGLPIGMCRGSECSQGYDILNLPLFDAAKRPVTEYYDWPEELRPAFSRFAIRQHYAPDFSGLALPDKPEKPLILNEQNPQENDSQKPHSIFDSPLLLPPSQPIHKTQG